MSAKTILLVEDEPVFASTACILLRQEGYKVIHVPNGEEAISKIKSAARSISLVLMDILLGQGMDGIQAAEKILKEYDIPILFLSSSTDPGVVKKTETITSYGYVVKSTGIPVLMASIKMAFRLHEANQTIQGMNETLRLALEASNAGTWDWDLVHSRYHWSPEFSKLFGMDTDTEPSYEAWEKSVLPEDREMVRKRLQEAIATRSNLHTEFRTLLSNRQIRWILATGKTIYEGDQPLRMIGLCLDITGRKQAEAKIKEAELRLGNLADNHSRGLSPFLAGVIFRMLYDLHRW